MKYLIDSDWVISCLRNNEPYLLRVAELKPEGVGLSIISVAEIYEGFYSARDPDRDEAAFREFISDGIGILTLDEEICRAFARERTRLRRAGRLIGDLDLFIACTALRHGLIVLTNNVQHFGRVERLEIISI